MTTDLASSGPLLRPNVEDGVTDLLARDTDLLNWFETRGFVKPNNGGSPYKWNLMTSETATAEIYVEGQALPAPGQPSYSQASVAAVYFRSVVANTGHMQDQVDRGGVYADPIELAIDNATKKLRTLVDQTLAGSAANKGIASIIDADDSYGGLDPALVTPWASLETPVGGAMTITVMDTLFRTLSDSPRSADTDTVLLNTNQAQKYANLFGYASTAARSLPRGEQGQPYDLGMAKMAMAHNGAEFVKVRTLANTELYALDSGSGIELREQRMLTVEPMAKVNDDKSLQITWALVPVFKNRRKHGKLTGLTA